MTQTPPQMGLMLKTLEMPQGLSGDTWADVEKSLGHARVYGVDFWMQVFDAFNPFGPQSRYISVYDGFLECPKAGVYEFATMSDDGSFLLVDGELVAKWPGQGHNIDESRHGEKNGRKDLAAGRHAFRYVGLAFDGGRRMAAAWMPPGGSKWQIIPPSAFPSVFAVPVLATDDSTRPICAAFGMEEFQYLECGNARMVAVQFTSESGAQAGALTQWFWEFGDGLVSRERDPVHVYMLPGRYQVTHTAHAEDQSSDSFTLTVEVEPLRQDQDFSFARRQRFWSWVQDYPVDKLATKPLLAFRSFLKEVEEPRRVFDAGVELDRRRKELSQAQLYSVAMDLAAYYTEPLRNWQAAEKCYLLALDQCRREETELPRGHPVQAGGPAFLLRRRRGEGRGGTGGAAGRAAEIRRDPAAKGGAANRRHRTRPGPPGCGAQDLPGGRIRPGLTAEGAAGHRRRPVRAAGRGRDSPGRRRRGARAARRMAVGLPDETARRPAAGAAAQGAAAQQGLRRSAPGGRDLPEIRDRRGLHPAGPGARRAGLRGDGG